MSKKNKSHNTYRTPGEKKRLRGSLVFFAFCLLLIPFLNLNTLIDPALSPKFTALTIGLLFFILWYSFSILKENLSIDLQAVKKPVFLILFLYVALSGLSVFKAVNPSEAVYDFLKNSVFFVFFVFSTLLFVNNKILPSAITKIVVVFSSLIIALSLFQTLNVMAHEALTDSSTKVVKAVFMNKNLYSQMLFLTLPFNLFGVFAFRKRWKMWCSVNSLLSLVMITLLITRSVWLALIVSFFLTFFFIGF